MTVFPFVYYALLPGSVGYLAVSTGLINLGTLIVAFIGAGAVYMIMRHGGRPATAA